MVNLDCDYKTNVMGTLNMLGLAKRIGARFLITSTSEVYGDPLEHPQKETYWGNVNPIGVLLAIGFDMLDVYICNVLVLCCLMMCSYVMCLCFILRR